MRAALLLFLACVLNSAEPARWTPIGLSGGGAMFAPVISPHDPAVMLVTCDMGAVYRTADAGVSWTMIHHDQLRACIACRPAFHPRDRTTIVAANGWNGERLRISRDGGATWSDYGSPGASARGELAFDPDDDARLLAGTSDGLRLTIDSGKTWRRCEGPSGAVIAVRVPTAGSERRTPATAWFCATPAGVWRSDDKGESWIERSTGLPWRDLRSFAACVPTDGSGPYLYCAIPSKVVDGELRGGVWRSLDGGLTWTSAMGTGINRDVKAHDRWAMAEVAQYHHVLASEANPGRVWAFNANTGIPPPHHTAAYRSDDRGATWQPTFFPDPRFPGTNVEPDYTSTTVKQFYQDVPGGVAIDPRDGDRVVQVDGGRCHFTTDAGRTWKSRHTARAGADSDAWRCTGLVVTSAWQHAIDPHDPARRYIAYTDIGFASSDDGGGSWRWWPLAGRAPWPNTCYQLALDPEVRGRAWGAFSDVHDIPNGNIIWGNHRADGGGGVCLSEDGCATWSPATGLPNAPATAVVMDPSSPVAARVLYAGIFGHGVFRSRDGGRTWEPRSAGLGSRDNRRVSRVVLHADGTLFAVITALRREGRFLADGVGVWRSRDQGGQWELVPGSAASLWPKDLTIDPADSRVLWLGTCDTSGAQTAGLFRTRDGGTTWQRMAREGGEHFGAYLHPTRRGWVYMTLTEGAPGSGLLLSRDDGATWTPMRGLPFANAMRVSFDPADEDVIYVATFGGSVWRGPADEQSE